MLKDGVPPLFRVQLNLSFRDCRKPQTDDDSKSQEKGAGVGVAVAVIGTDVVEPTTQGPALMEKSSSAISPV